MSDARGDGSMLAALGGDDDVVVADRRATTASSSPTTTRRASSCSPASARALRAAGNALREAGVRVLELNVAGAFHSPFMADAVPEFDRRAARAPTSARRASRSTRA